MSDLAFEGDLRRELRALRAGQGLHSLKMLGQQQSLVQLLRQWCRASNKDEDLLCCRVLFIELLSRLGPGEKARALYSAYALLMVDGQGLELMAEPRTLVARRRHFASALKVHADTVENYENRMIDELVVLLSESRTNSVDPASAPAVAPGTADYVVEYSEFDYYVNRQMVPERYQFSYQIRALRDGLESVQITDVYTSDPRAGVSEIFAMHNCTVSSNEVQPGLLVAEIKFARTLRRNERFIYAYGGRVNSIVPMHPYIYFDPPTTVQERRLRVHFVETPKLLWKFEYTKLSAPELFTPSNKLKEVEDGVFEYVFVNAVPGHWYGMAWEWKNDLEG